MTSYLIVVKTSGFGASGVVQKCMNLAHLPDQNIMLIVFTAAILYPLSLFKKIKWIGYTSMVSIFFLFAFIVTVAVQYFEYPCEQMAHVHSCKPEAVDVTLDTFFVLPTMALSFVCHTG
jgi:sodium-coupled neutral amino acid transporter 6